MKLCFNGRDKHGTYRLRYENQILYSVVIGAVGASLVKKFIADMLQMYDSIEDHKWGYLADLSQCQAWTLEAENTLPDAHKKAMERGCVVDAYLMGTALLREQAKKVRKNAEIDSDIDQHIFADIPSAERFIRSIIEHLAKQEA